MKNYIGSTVSRACFGALLSAFVFLSIYPARADEEEKTIPLKDAGSIPNSKLLVGAVNRFENSGIPLPYPVFVVDIEEVNAWADGRKLFFCKGLLNFVESEGEVAYVLGHEMTHNISGHPEKQTYGIIGLVLVNAFLSNDYQYQPGRQLDFERSQLSQDITISLLAFSYSRTQEYSADRNGVFLMVEAGYDPNDAIKFQERLLKKSPESPGLFASLLASHPTSENRIQQKHNIIANDLYQDEKGAWHRREQPIQPEPKRNTPSRKMNRGLQMAAITGGLSFLSATLEQSSLESDGVVNSSQRQHNVLIAVRNGVVLGFLTGTVLIVDVPGSPAPAFLGREGQPSHQPITLRYNLEQDRWELEKGFHF
jgi:Zn-dependent protease with chaperone function